MFNKISNINFFGSNYYNAYEGNVGPPVEQVMSSTSRSNQPFSVTSLLTPLDSLATTVDVTGRGGSCLAPSSVNDFASAAAVMQNPYGVSPMAHMAQFGTHSTYQYCNTDLSHYAAPATASWYGSTTTDPRFASKYHQNSFSQSQKKTNTILRCIYILTAFIQWR